MDPFSLTTACVGLLAGIAQLSAQIAVFVSSVRDTRRDMDAVSRELTSLSLCLGTLRDDSAKVQYPDGLRENLIVVLKNCDWVVRDMTALLEKLSSANLKSDIQWTISGKDDMNRLRSSLESHKSALEIALDMTNLLLISNVKTDTAAIRFETAQISSIKQDTSRIEVLVNQIGFLRLQLDDASREDGKAQQLQKFLDQSTTYAETVIDNLEHDWDDASPRRASPEIIVEDSEAPGTGSLIRGGNKNQEIAEAQRSTTMSPEQIAILHESVRIVPHWQRFNATSRSPNAGNAEPAYSESPRSTSYASGNDPSMITQVMIKDAARRRQTLSLRERRKLDMKLESAVRGKKSLKQKLWDGNDWLSEKVESYAHIKTLLESGASPNYIGLSRADALDIEKRNSNRSEIIQLLNRYGALISSEEIRHHAIKLWDEWGRSEVVGRAVSEGNLVATKICIDNGAPVNTPYRESPLIGAMKSKNLEMVKLLLDHGVWVRKEDLEMFNTIDFPDVQGGQELTAKMKDEIHSMMMMTKTDD